MLIKGDISLPKDRGGVLLIQLGDIGDVVLTMPTIKALRQNFPENELVVSVREAARELLEDCPWPDRVISVNKGKRGITEEIIYQKNFINALRKTRFHLAVDLRTGTRGAVIALLSGAHYRIGRFADDGRLLRNRAFTHLVRPVYEESQYSTEHNLNIISPFGLGVDSILPTLSVSQLMKRKAQAILKEAGVPLDGEIMAIHPFSLWKYKEWNPKGFVSLIDHIETNHGLSVVITGSPEERGRVREMIKGRKERVFNLAGKTSIGELPALLQRCSLFIGVDTAALHIAAAVDVPTVGIFGPSSSVNWAPKGDQHLVVKKNMPCVPCREKGCKGSGTSRCLNELEAEEVARAVDEQLLKRKDRLN